MSRTWWGHDSTQTSPSELERQQREAHRAQLKAAGFTHAEVELALDLMGNGCEQQSEVPRAFWYNNHCFYIHPDKGLIEL